MTSCALYLVAALLSSSLAAPQLNPKDAFIVLLENDFNGIDPWFWSYESSDGTFHEERGAEADGTEVQGRYSWTPPDAGGGVYKVDYTAGVNGYVAKVVFGTQVGAGASTPGADGGAQTPQLPPNVPPSRNRIGINSQLTLIG